MKQTQFKSPTKKTGIKHHHLNDCVAIDDSLYVSMFSISDNYGKEFYDGAILEIDLNNFKNKNLLKNNLWMPHNIRYFNKSSYIEFI